MENWFSLPRTHAGRQSPKITAAHHLRSQGGGGVIFGKQSERWLSIVTRWGSTKCTHVSLMVVTFKELAISGENP